MAADLLQRDTETNLQSQFEVIIEHLRRNLFGLDAVQPLDDFASLRFKLVVRGGYLAITFDEFGQVFDLVAHVRPGWLFDVIWSAEFSDAATRTLDSRTIDFLTDGEATNMHLFDLVQRLRSIVPDEVIRQVQLESAFHGRGSRPCILASFEVN